MRTSRGENRTGGDDPTKPQEVVRAGLSSQNGVMRNRRKIIDDQSRPFVAEPHRFKNRCHPRCFVVCLPGDPSTGWQAASGTGRTAWPVVPMSARHRPPITQEMA